MSESTSNPQKESVTPPPNEASPKEAASVVASASEIPPSSEATLAAEKPGIRVTYEVRRARYDDQDAILALLEPFVAQKKLLRRTRAEVLLLMGTGYVAEIKSESTGDPSNESTKTIIGFSAVEIYSRKLGEIQCLAVADGYHGNGIGGALVKACVELARDKGILEVMAISASDSFLKNLGFDYSLPDQKRALFYQLHARDEIFNTDE